VEWDGRNFSVNTELGRFNVMERYHKGRGNLSVLPMPLVREKILACLGDVQREIY